MSWSKDQRPAHAHTLSARSASQVSTHPAKSIMDERWEQRRAAATARRAEVTTGVVLGRADISGVQRTEARLETSETPLAELVLADMAQLELKDASEPHAFARIGAGTAWLRDTQRAMVMVAALSCGVLLALLYFGGFLG